MLEIDGASNNSVDDIRQLRDNVGYTSMGGKYRIFVIDEVHMLSKAAFNALLKTLEEPPPQVIFIFATTEPQKIPATIHSRCQRYDFRRIVPEQIMGRLEYICTQEKVAFEKTVLMLIARKAEGSMRDALSLLDQACSYCPEKLAEAEVRIVLGLVGMEVYERIMNAAAEKSPAAAVAVVQDVLHQGFDLHEFVLGLEEHLRNLLFSRIPGAIEGSGTALESGAVERLRASSGRFSEGDLLRMLEIVRRTENDVKWSSLPRFAVEIMLLKLVLLDRTVHLEQLLGLLGDAGETGDGPAMPAASAPAVPDVKKKPEIAQVQPRNQPVKKETAPFPAGETAPEFAGPAVLEEPPLDDAVPEPDEEIEQFDDRFGSALASGITGRWPAFVESLMRDRPNIGTFLSLATVAGSTESSVDLSYPSSLKFQFTEVTKKPHRDEIVKMLAAFMGKPVEVHITLDPKESRNAAQNYIKQPAHAAAIESEMEREPVIQAVLDIFDGEILR